MDLDGLVAAVTGGSSGIGAATVVALRDRGVTAYALDLNVPTEDPLALRCDVTDDEQIVDAFKLIGGKHGRLDMLINNAGIGASGNVSENDRNEWQRVLDVNVVSAARASSIALPLLQASQNASIVHVSSIVASVGVRNRALYSASKGAIHALTLAMAADFVSEGIRVNSVAPGTAATPWVDRLLSNAADPAAEAEALRARQPLGRLVTPEEVANAIIYLASPAAGSTTGAILPVDGGMGSLK